MIAVKNKLSETIAAMLVVCAALGWWGVLYPQFTLNKDTCIVVSEEAEDCMDGGELYRRLLSADRRQVRIKSRFLLRLESVWEYLQEEFSKND